jgi:hypothetical protein
MDVGAAGYTQQMQTQMRKMDGSGGGQGQGGGGGMKNIMQSLSPEDQTAMKDQMSSLSQTDRASMVSQLKEVDSTQMTSEEYTQSLLDVLNQDKTATDTSSAAYDFSVYG